VLVLVVVVAVAGTLLGTGRRAVGAARVRRAEARVGQALLVGPDRDTTRERVTELAGTVRTMPAAEAGAVVLASRRAFSRDIIPVLVAALGHRDASVGEDASRALADLGSPGLRAVWQALDGIDGEAPALEAFLRRHPDWLFQRLVEGYAASGETSVRRHERLWRESGMLGRLTLLQRGSDAINALRANAISRLLGLDGGRVA